MKTAGLIGFILLGLVTRPGETYKPGTLCLYQAKTFYERFGLEYAYRIINRRAAARVILVHNVSSIYTDVSMVEHKNDVMMFMVGRTSKMFELYTEINIKHPAAAFDFAGEQIDDGNEDFLEWVSKYVPPYDVGNETTLPPFMLREDSTKEEDFADQFLESKYPNCTFNDSRSSMDSERLSDLSLSMPTRRYRSDRKFEKGKRITQYDSAALQQDEEDEAVREKVHLDKGITEPEDVDDEQKEQEDADREKEEEVRLYRAKKPRKVTEYKMRAYTKRSKNKVVYAKMGPSIDYARDLYKVQSIRWPAVPARLRSPNRAGVRNRIRPAYQPMQVDYAPIDRMVYWAPQGEAIPLLTTAKKAHMTTKEHTIAKEHTTAKEAHTTEIAKTTKVKVSRKTKSAQAKKTRAKKVIKSAAKVVGNAADKPVAKVIAKSAVKAAAKSAAKAIAESNNAAKPAAKTRARSAAKAAVKPAAKKVAKSAPKKAVRSVAKKAVKPAAKRVLKLAKNAAKGSLNEKPKARGRKKSTSTLLDYMTYMYPGPFKPYINTKPEERTKKAIG